MSREVHDEYVSALDHKTHYEKNPGSIEYYDKDNGLEKIEFIDYGNIKADYATISTEYFDLDGSIIRSTTTEESLHDRLGNDYPPPKVNTGKEDTIRFTAVLEKDVDYAWSEKAEWRPWGEDSEPDKTKFVQRYFDTDNKLIREEYYNMDSCKYDHSVPDKEKDAMWGRVRVVEYEKDGSVCHDLHWREYPGEAITKEEYEYLLARYEITSDYQDKEPYWDDYWEHWNKPDTDEASDTETGYDVDCNSDDEDDSGSDDVDSSEND